MMTESGGVRAISPIFNVGPICALQILETDNDTVLAGEGPILKAYNFKTGDVIARMRAFPRNKVHGISVYETEKPELVAVFGGRSLSVISYDHFKKNAAEFKEYAVGDWILAVEFSLDGSKLYCLTAHNVVVTVDVASMMLIDSKNCGWKSILYSGSIKALKDGRILICSGTVMNGILVWELTSSKLLYNLTDHEGSIFGVKPSNCGKYLLSCSDDRSIRVWDLSKGELLATGWGHGARIWGLSFFSFDSNHGFKVFSCSEDCTARVWKYANGSGELVQQRLISCHTGRSIWSECVNDKLKIGFTGGADGKLKVHDLAPDIRLGYVSCLWTVSGISKQTDIGFEKVETIKSYYDFGYGLFAVSSLGKCFAVNNSHQWNHLFEDARFARFSLVTGFKHTGIVVLCNKSGIMILLKFDSTCNLLSRSEILIPTISRLGNILTSSTNDKLLLLAESPNPQDCLVLQEIDEATSKVIYTSLLVKPQENIAISSLLYDADTQYLVVGSRFATIILYDMSIGTEVPVCAYYKNQVKGDTVSELLVASADKISRELSFYVTMKDGRFYIIKVGTNRQMEILEDNRLQRGFLEGLLIGSNGELLLYGFKSDCFYVWNETTQDEIVRIVCGGPHRQWSFYYWHEEGKLRFRFVFTRASDIMMVQNGSQQFVDYLNVGLHGREIRSMAVMNGPSENEKLLISGGEDTTVKLSELKMDGTIKLLWTQRQHGSGLQSVHVVNDEYVMSSSAREELYLWKVSQATGKPSICLYRTIRPISKHPDLRVMDFDTLEIKDKGKPIGFIVATVYSNSLICLWYFNYVEKSYKMFVNDYYRQCCILSVHFMILRGKIYLTAASTNGYLSIYNVDSLLSKYFELGSGNTLIMTGDGTFEVSKLGRLIVDKQLHQSSIKALDYRYVSESEIVIVTGGDDNSLILSKINMKNDAESDSVQVEVLSYISDAAASTITCVNMIDENRVVVSSVDQKFRVWSIKGGNLQLLDDEYTTVADIGCAVVSEFNGVKMVLIGGAGVSVWKLNE
ncbi:hypothetical protein FOA43_000993 [Brettanomyces nanus]|uniref:Uncharacterized protein n=1 Tax=Eeniella nana TaxID=13502 RepID=A0A875RNH1_EENNA|nr:uncharacterized protein FOA43_000993 [Brettanomyces nanus]QPG73680.1 hypothetical protein FOA43_000993 [Brettanomyces nanus]